MSETIVKWRPIRTAPKDGRRILLVSKGDKFDAGPNGHVVRPPSVHIGEWNKRGTSWVDKKGTFKGKADHLKCTGVWFSEGGWLQPNEVSHWAPLPHPPKKKKN